MNKEVFQNVFMHKMVSHIPLWELHFHLWKKISNGAFLSGQDFNMLSKSEQDYAIKRNAALIVEIGEQYGFAAVSVPDSPWDCIYTLPFERRLQLIKELRSLDPDFCITAACGGVFSVPSNSDEYVSLCYKLYDEPDEIDKECERKILRFLDESNRLIDVGVEVIYIAADIADNRSPFLNENQLLRWYYPYLKRAVDHLKRSNIISILHTDGNVGSMLDGFLGCGIDGLQAIDPYGKMDIVAVQKYFDGKAVVCGNFDCGLMLTGKPDDIYSEAFRLFTLCGHAGGFVAGNSNAVVAETPLANYNAFHQAWTDYNGRRRP